MLFLKQQQQEKTDNIKILQLLGKNVNERIEIKVKKASEKGE